MADSPHQADLTMDERSVRAAEMPRPAAAALVPGPAANASFAEIYDATFAFAWRTARRLGTPEANLDDVVQEIFLVAHRRQHEFEGRSSIKTWIYGIVFNVVRAHRRELAAKHPHALHDEGRADPDLVVDAADGPDERTAKREAARVVDRFLQGLDDERREVFVLVELEQMSAPEIAALLGIPLNTVYSRLRLARLEFSKAVARHRARDTRRSP
jgi:RNA polymerase sigma-70 factor (ECF subfamily)